MLLTASACCFSVAFASRASATASSRNAAEAMESELADVSQQIQLPEASSLRNSGQAPQEWRRGRDLFSFSDSIFGKFKTGSTFLGADTCTYEPDSFESNLVAEFIGNPELLTDDDIKKLQDAFVESYNEVAGGLCDEQFRSISSSTFFNSQLEDTNSMKNRYLQGVGAELGSTDGSPKKPRRFSLKIFVLGNCRRCDKDVDLFDDAFRRLQESFTTDTLVTGGAVYTPRVTDRRPIDNPEGGKLIWSQSEFNCDCIEETTLPDRPPSLDEFNSAYEKKVKKMADDGSLTTVKKALGVSPIVQVPCEDVVDDFSSEVLVEAEGDPDNITEEELDIMKELFIISYESAIVNVCDSLFRLVVGAEVTVEESKGRRLQTTSGRFRPFRFRFKVSGKCKGCEVDERLFDDAFRRSLVEEAMYPPFMNTYQRELGYIFNGEECYCVSNSPDRAPYEEEFGGFLQENVVEAALPNVLVIGEITQIDDTLPSASPSMAPTTETPSAAPTEFPTPAPTEYPTFMPSITLSSSPSTPYPSAEPSPSPSNPTVPTESPMPSPQPSLSPTTD